MSSINRRDFGALLLSATGGRLMGANGIGETLNSAVKQRNIPVAVAIVATKDRTTYAGAFGKRDPASGIDVTTDSIFRIASMTKAITSVAALQLVERGTLNLDEPVAKRLPQLTALQILRGFDEQTGKPELKRAVKPVTLRHLLTHTSGFAYENWNANLRRYVERTDPVPPERQRQYHP
ncbi:MAG: beta-lactamase family protein [Acidobacteriota bacterium]|nr:beta-lactamase family protein [Acidobacteriota bacterium]